MRDRRVEAGDCSRDDRIHGESHAARSTVMASGIISCHSAVQPRAQKSLGGLSFHSRLRTRIYETGLRLARSAARCFLSHGAFFWCPLPLRGGPRRARTPHVGAMQALLLAYSSLPTWYA